MKIKYLLFVVGMVTFGNLFAQEAHQPSNVVTGTHKGLTDPLRDFPIMTEVFNDPNVMTIVPHNINAVEQRENTTISPTIIQNLQTEPGQITAYPISQNFIGASQNESGYLPPDPTGAVGPNHYVHSVNSIVKIFDMEKIN